MANQNTVIATVGVGTYPLQGRYKSVRTATNSKTRPAIKLARQDEGLFLAKRLPVASMDERQVIEGFDAVK